MINRLKNLGLCGLADMDKDRKGFLATVQQTLFGKTRLLPEERYPPQLIMIGGLVAKIVLKGTALSFLVPMVKADSSSYSALKCF